MNEFKREVCVRDVSPLWLKERQEIVASASKLTSKLFKSHCRHCSNGDISSVGLSSRRLFVVLDKHVNPPSGGYFSSLTEHNPGKALWW